MKNSTLRSDDVESDEDSEDQWKVVNVLMSLNKRPEKLFKLLSQISDHGRVISTASMHRGVQQVIYFL